MSRRSGTRKIHQGGIQHQGYKRTTFSCPPGYLKCKYDIYVSVGMCVYVYVLYIFGIHLQRDVWTSVDPGLAQTSRQAGYKWMLLEASTEIWSFPTPHIRSPFGCIDIETLHSRHKFAPMPSYCVVLTFWTSLHQREMSSLHWIIDYY